MNQTQGPVGLCSVCLWLRERTVWGQRHTARQLVWGEMIPACVYLCMCVCVWAGFTRRPACPCSTHRHRHTHRSLLSGPGLFTTPEKAHGKDPESQTDRITSNMHSAQGHTCFPCTLIRSIYTDSKPLAKVTYLHPCNNSDMYCKGAFFSLALSFSFGEFCCSALFQKQINFKALKQKD